MRSCEKFQEVPYQTRLRKFGVPPRTATNLVPSYEKEKDRLDSLFLKSLFIYGPCGCGKSTLAAMSLLYHSEQFHCSLKRRAAGKSLKFITLPQLLLELRKSYGRRPEHSVGTRALSSPSDSEEKQIERYKSIDILVLDDFGAEKTTDWSLTMLYLILSHRYEYNKVTILTSNLSLDELTNQLGDARLTSRIGGWCTLIHMKGEDKRKRG